MTNRFDVRRAAGTRNRELGEQSDGEMRYQDSMAKAAERWAAAYLGADTQIIEGNHPDRGWDLELADGRRVDVKWTKTYPGKWYGKTPGYPTLNLSTWKRGRGRPDLYLLIMGELLEDFDRYSWAAGWATAAEIVKAPIIEGKHGRPYHALGFDYLHPLEELLALHSPA